MCPDRESLQGEAVSQKRSRLFHSAKTRLSLVLGLLMLTFGLLKVVSPTIDGWFHVQIQQSHLPHAAILMGKIAEILTGILFVLPRFRPWPARWEGRILLIACASLFLEMLVAVYVHLQPGVPSEVLPLGIKPPVIPLFVLLLDVMVAIPAWNDSQTEGLRFLNSE
jgi:predicted neutral ceramidase superfamily lipid hydrolase